MRLLATCLIVGLALSLAATTNEEDPDALVPEHQLQQREDHTSDDRTAGEVTLDQHAPAGDDELWHERSDEEEELQMSSEEIAQAKKTFESLNAPIPTTCAGLKAYAKTKIPKLEKLLKQFTNGHAQTAVVTKALEELKWQANQECNDRKAMDATEKLGETETEQYDEGSKPQPRRRTVTTAAYEEAEFGPNAELTEEFQASLLQEATKYPELAALDASLKEIMKEHAVARVHPKRFSPKEHNSMIASFFVDHVWGFAEASAKAEASISGASAIQAQKCLQGIVEQTPQSFCWKDHRHNHDIPKKCKAGYHHWGAECFKNCRSGYYWVGGGTCWSRCPSGWSNLGPTCGRGFWSRRRWGIKAKRHYWASRYTHFSSVSLCNYADQYKEGALCYKKCQVFKTPDMMQGCGFDACAVSPTACISEILNFITSIAISIISIVSLGTATPATKAATAVSKKGIGAALKAGLKMSFSKAGRAKFRSNVWKNLKNKFKNKKQEFIEQKLTMASTKMVCGGLADGFFDRTVTGPTKFTAALAQVDPTGIMNAAAKCTETCDPVTKYCAKVDDFTCGKSVVGALATFDPTGVLGVAAAFMHKTCVDAPADSNPTDWPNSYPTPAPTGTLRRRRSVMTRGYGDY